MSTSTVSPNGTAKRLWAEILDQAAAIVESYATLVTLRQLFYRLVVARILENTLNAYKARSHHTAAARRDDDFPALADPTRQIHRFQTFADVSDAQRWLSRIYRRDRTEGQEYNVYLAVEKEGIVQQLRAWFADLGVPILALHGYASQSYVDDIVADVEADGRPAILIYAGDLDPSGEDIQRDFEARTAIFDEVVRVAVTPAQIAQYNRLSRCCDDQETLLITAIGPRHRPRAMCAAGGARRIPSDGRRDTATGPRLTPGAVRRHGATWKSRSWTTYRPRFCSLRRRGGDGSAGDRARHARTSAASPTSAA
jgi:hypothetical protein